MANSVSPIPSLDQVSTSKIKQVSSREQSVERNKDSSSTDERDRNFQQTLKNEHVRADKPNAGSSKPKVTAETNRQSVEDTDVAAESISVQNISSHDAVGHLAASTPLSLDLPVIDDGNPLNDLIPQDIAKNLTFFEEQSALEEAAIGVSTFANTQGQVNTLVEVPISSVDRETPSQLNASLVNLNAPLDNLAPEITLNIETEVTVDSENKPAQLSTTVPLQTAFSNGAAVGSANKESINLLSSDISQEELGMQSGNTVAFSGQNKIIKPDYLLMNSETIVKSPGDVLFAKNGIMLANTPYLSDPSKQLEQGFSEQLDAIKVDDRSAKVTSGASDAGAVKPNISNIDKVFVSANIRFGSPAWAGQIAERTANLVSQNIKNAEIHLNPQDMGPIHIKISVANDQASISFSANNAQVREALDATMQRLKDALSEEGLDLVKADVKDQQAQQREQQQHSQGRWGRAVEQDQEAESHSGLYVPKSAVDHFV